MDYSAKGAKRNILLGVCGSVAAYKAHELTRTYVKNNYNIKIIFTKGALEFVKPEAFLSLGAEEVYYPGDDFEDMGEFLHIELARWATQFVIAPLSANTLSKLAHGEAEDLLCTTFLAYAGPLYLAPAMNPIMLSHPLVRRNFKILGEYIDMILIPAQTGVVACGEEGEGKLAPVESIFYQSLIPYRHKGKKVLITAGATKVPLDPIRFISNRSTGSMGFELALKFLKEGHKVEVLCSKDSYQLFEKLLGISTFSVGQFETVEELEADLNKKFPTCDILISAAAVSDYGVDYSETKIKKSQEELSLSLKKGPDLLANVLKVKNHQVVVGFAAETDSLEKNMEEKFRRKPVDLLVGNQVGKQKGFGEGKNNYQLMGKQGRETCINMNKAEIAHKIFEYLHGAGPLQSLEDRKGSISEFTSPPPH